ncbi:MAG TPA: pantetheine-phosphate adenylyltransferase [Patescibacteria group bacterium]
MHKKRHQLVGLGGTFDHFHKGHEFFIEYANQLSEKLVIGITDAHLSKSKLYPELIQTFHQRLSAVKQFCERQQIKAEFIKLSDPYGPTIDRQTRIQAIVVTEETAAGAEKINEIRQASQARPLPVYVAPMVKDEVGQELHADRIRSGEVSRQGRVYRSHLTADLHITEAQKSLLRQPLGHLVDEPTATHEQQTVYLVGDATLEKFVENDWLYDLAVYDQRQLREQTSSAVIKNIQPDVTVDNPASTITLQLVKVLENALQENQKHILVNGEEDLATVVLILLAPLKTCLYYGQPHRGLVEVIVTEQLKDKVFRILFG